MRRLSKVVLTIGLALLLASLAWAQQGQRQRGFGFGFGGPSGLLRNEGVQKELKMEQEQIDKATAALQKVQEKHQDDFGKLRDLGQEERREKMQAIGKAISEESMKAVEGILKPEQVKRLNQISLQQRGADAFTDTDVQKGLKLTVEQRGKIKTITEDARKEMQGLFQPGGDFQEAQKKMTAMRKETMEKVSALLTDDQKKAWKDMAGEPFEVRFQPRRNQ
jgi:hypothetical protein